MVIWKILLHWFIKSSKCSFIFHYKIIKKLHLLISSIIWYNWSHQKVSKNWEAFSNLPWQIQVFQNSNFCLKTQTIIGDKFRLLFSLMWHVYFVHFQENVCKISNSDNVVCEFFELKMIHTKEATSAHKTEQMFFLETIITLQKITQVLYMYFPFHHSEYWEKQL